MSESYGIRAARPADVEALPGVERSAVALYRRVMDELGPDLRQVVEGERRRGLRMELRVIMRREATC